MLKPTEALLECDPRFRDMVKLSPETGESRPMCMEDLWGLVESVELHVSVPQSIRDQFDIARNAFVYSWFVYEFASLAEKHSFTVLEMALRRRTHPEESPDTSRSPGLRSLLDAAKENGWLRAADFEMPSISGSDGTMSRLDLLLQFRNHALHGNVHLLPQETPTVLGLCAEVINKLFALPAHAGEAVTRDDQR
jgi:hypothetical protein